MSGFNMDSTLHGIYSGNMVPPQYALSQHLLNCAQASNQSPITIEKIAGKIF